MAKGKGNPPARRVVVSLEGGGGADLGAMAQALSRDAGMRVGAVFTRQGAIVGEVPGEIEVARIRGIPGVSGVRVAGGGDAGHGRKPERTASS